ncbi:organic solute transporter subunit alpha-like [Bolinopsis microptera]|uniref:organic solute transporter subunit alpha-like n=1 Tax=Bolinopsis microptera TaxID=2820187 RepID=UPI003079F784
MGEPSPSFSEILEKGYPPEWLPFIIIATAMTLAMIVLDIWAFIQHKKYSTKFPIQFMCTIGILQVYPFFCFMQLIGMIVPKSHEVTVFLSEGLEALTFLFFLRLLFTYMGGKKATKSTLKGAHMHINVPPLCCLVCLPQVKFTRKFFIFCEFLIGLYAVYCLGVGFLELIMMLDAGDGYPNPDKGAHVISGTFGAIYHVLLIVLLFFAIYGLSGIYHSAEELLGHRGIVKKFLVYKIFTLLAKFQDLLFGTLVHHDVITDEDFKYNEIWPAGLRVRNCVAFAICVEAMISFPLALKFYNIADYVVIEDNGTELKRSSKEDNPDVVENDAVEAC